MNIPYVDIAKRPDEETSYKTKLTVRSINSRTKEQFSLAGGKDYQLLGLSCVDAAVYLPPKQDVLVGFNA